MVQWWICAILAGWNQSKQWQSTWESWLEAHQILAQRDWTSDSGIYILLHKSMEPSVSHRSQACSKSIAVMRVLMCPVSIGGRSFPSTSANMLHKSQRELTCNRRTSLSSRRNLTEAVVSLCNSCKLDSVQAMTVNLRILTGSSQEPLGVWRLVGFHGSSRSCKANMLFSMSVPFIFRNRWLWFIVLEPGPATLNSWGWRCWLSVLRLLSACQPSASAQQNMREWKLCPNKWHLQKLQSMLFFLCSWCTIVPSCLIPWQFEGLWSRYLQVCPGVSDPALSKTKGKHEFCSLFTTTGTTQ